MGVKVCLWYVCRNDLYRVCECVGVGVSVHREGMLVVSVGVRCQVFVCRCGCGCTCNLNTLFQLGKGGCLWVCMHACTLHVPRCVGV